MAACGERFARSSYVGEGDPVTPTAALVRLGGVADLAALTALTSRAKLRSAVQKGDVIRVAHGRYALPTADEGLRAAARLSGTASHATAAVVHRWQVGTQPERPAVIVPRNRKVPPSRRTGVDVRWRNLTPAEVVGSVTEPHRTVIDCAADLEFREALAIADSALRHRDVDRDRLLSMAAARPSKGRSEALRVVRAASPFAANPFESMLRGIALDVPGLNPEPQVWIEERGFRGRPDLVDRKRRLVIEAESFEFHGRRKALKRDCERYTALVVRGWTVVRFAWEHVMFDPDYVQDALTALTQPSRRATLPPTLLYTA
jgi:very-short-patch-repair endonuclease